MDTISWSRHLETSLEIALTAHTHARVSYLNLRDALPFVEDSSWMPAGIDAHGLMVRRTCELMQKSGVEVISHRISAVSIQKANTLAGTMLDACLDPAAVCRLSYGSFVDIGWGVLSSAVSKTRNPFVSHIEHRKLFKSLLTSAILTYDAVNEYIASTNCDTVVLFNGRYATTRAVYRAATNADIKALIHERGCDIHHYALTSGLTQNPDFAQRQIQDFWHHDLAEAGEQYFRDRRNRVERSWHSYTKGQNVGKLPPEMNDKSKWIVFFTSSEDEFVSIGDVMQNQHFPRQENAIRAVAEAVRQLPGYRLCIRMHPHIAKKSQQEQSYWKSLCVPEALIVEPLDDYDSYAIMDHAHVVCSYGSTTGVEATFWGKPSLLLGRSCYDKLDVAYSATNLDEIKIYLRTPRAYPKLGALMYGAFYSRFGVRYVHYQARDLFKGVILGTDLNGPLMRIWRGLVRSQRNS